MATEGPTPLDAWVEESGARTGCIDTPRDSPGSVDEGTISPLGGVHLMVPRLPLPERCAFSVDDRGIDGGAEHDSVIEPWILTTSDTGTMPTEGHQPDDGDASADGMTSSNNRRRSHGDSSSGSCSRLSGGSLVDPDAQAQSSTKFTTSGSHVHPHHQQHYSIHRPRTTSSFSGASSRAPPERSSGECLNSPTSCTGGGHRNGAPSPRLGISPARFKGSGLGSPAVSSPRSESPGTCGGGGNDGSGFSPKKQGRRPSDSQMQARRNGDSLGGVSHNFKVVIRVRPPLPREVDGERMFQNIVSVDKDEHVITISENLEAVLDEDGSVVSAGGPYSTHVFTFDHVYDVSSSQQKVYDTTAREVVDSSLRGYNATVFAYGQTGTGKTFTMEGFKRGASSEDRGIIPRAIEQVFAHIQRNAFPRMRFLVRASYLQIYNEQISDLLKPERSNLAIREDKKRGVFVEGLSEWVVRTPGEIYGLMERGGQLRATGATRMNDTSSRSHAVFIIIVEQSETCYADERGKEISPEAVRQLLRRAGPHEREALVRRLDKDARQTFKVGKLNLVDLAGSERVRLSGATGQRLQESKKINQSLSALGNVISALTDHRGRQHIPYRDSKLTRLLEDSLGGNCKTTMMAMISPALESMVETLSTVKFASRAKSIKNQPIVNEDFDQKSLLRKYERELKRLRAELEERSRNLVDKRQLLYVEGERRRAEADKMAAIRALEERSLEFQREKEEKRLLEGRIAMLTGQMIGRGRRADAGSDGAEYADRLADLERERNTIELEKEQVERYKQLLMKQRDIMIALTQRLNERDDAICELNDELDANEAHQELLEDALDMRTQQLFHLQKTLVLHSGGGEGGGEGDVDHLLSRTPEETLGTATASAQSPQSAPPHNQHRPSTAPAHATALGVSTSFHGRAVSEAKGAAASIVKHSWDSSTNRLAASPVGNSPVVIDGQTPAAAEAGERNVIYPSQDELLTFPRFEPHPLVQPTLFSTDNPAGGVALHDEGVLAGGKGGSGGGGRGGQEVAAKGCGGARLLNAWEKIDELEGLVESSRADNERLLEDLEEVQTDKVSMEYLLREKLERLVQSEIEARVARMHEDGGVDAILRRQVDGLRVEAVARARSEASLREEIKRLKCSQGVGPEVNRSSSDSADGSVAREVRELDELRAENARLREGIPENREGRDGGGKPIPEGPTSREEVATEGKAGRGGTPQGEVGVRTKHRDADWSDALQDRCEALRGERKAMQKIMEQKVQVLVDNVTDSARTVLKLITVDEQGEEAAAAPEVFNGERGVGGVEATGTAAKAATAEDDDDSAATRAARDARGALRKDLDQLRRLVQAAIGALRIAEKEDDERTQDIAAAHHAMTKVVSREATAATAATAVTPAATSTGNGDRTDEKVNSTVSGDRIKGGERTKEDPEEQAHITTIEEGSAVLLHPYSGEDNAQSSPSCSIDPEASIGGAGVGVTGSSGLAVAALHEDALSRLETSNDGIGDDTTSPCRGRKAPREDAYSSFTGVENFARGESGIKPGDMCCVPLDVGGDDDDTDSGGTCESEGGGGEEGSEV